MWRPQLGTHIVPPLFREVVVSGIWASGNDVVLLTGISWSCMRAKGRIGLKRALTLLCGREGGGAHGKRAKAKQLGSFVLHESPMCQVLTNSTGRTLQFTFYSQLTVLFHLIVQNNI